MGYEMRWKLRVQPEDAPEVAELRWPDDARKDAPSLATMLGPYGETVTWYRADEHMRALSARFPSLHLMLEVHNAAEPGLSPPERWHFKGGKVHKVVAAYDWPDFDPAKLA